MNPKLEAALLYGRMHWRIFPCHSVVQTAAGPACSCGKVSCKSPAKHPRTKRGLLDATDDESTIRRWWTRWSDANIALATGSGLAVFDIDGPEGSAEFTALVKTYGPVPATLAAATGRGCHLIFATQPGSPGVRSSAMGKVHVRGEGGYIIVAPSDHISGRKYKWVHRLAPAPLPDWLRQWGAGYNVTAHATQTAQNSPFEALGAVPAYLQISQSVQRDVAQSASDALRTVWSPGEEARLISALAAIPANQYDSWYQIGMALHGLGWDRSDGTSIGFDIWDQWSQTCPEKYALGTCETKWRSFDRSARGELTLGTIYHLARQRGWNPASQVASPGAAAGHLNGHANGHRALPAAFGGQQPIIFPDVNDKGLPRATMTNAKVAVSALGVDCRYDLFHNRMLVAGEVINKWHSKELSDHVVTILRNMIRYRFGFDPGKQHTQDASESLALELRFDPVLDYLDSLRWDGRPRLDRWMVDYLGADDTELNRAIGRLSLLAAVRRARQPGTKFDQIIVLEGRQGQGKSEAIEILAGKENFSDQSILGVNDRKQQELTEGVWLYEIGELNGIHRSDIEHIKAFAPRKVDRARPAYGRYTVSQPRRTVFFASCNRDDYLQDDTGNRRFWPVAVRFADHDGLRRDRDQLWAEASAREARGESHVLEQRLWAAAGEEQEKRVAADSWVELIHRYLNMPDKNRDDVSIADVLCDNQFIAMRPDAIGKSEEIKAGRVMAALRFERYQKRLADGTRVYRYRRPRD